MSPEQAQGLPVDARSDLYSLAAVLYEAATGNPLVAAGLGDYQARKFVVEANRIERLQAVPLPLRGILLRALERAPEARFQRAEDFRHALGVA